MVEKIISSVVFIVWGEKGGAGGVGEGGIMLNSAESIPQTQHPQYIPAVSARRGAAAAYHYSDAKLLV